MLQTAGRRAKPIGDTLDMLSLSPCLPLQAKRVADRGLGNTPDPLAEIARRRPRLMLTAEPLSPPFPLPGEARRALQPWGCP